MTNSLSAPSVLITGANKGLGREAARRLSALGWTVWLGSRDLAAGQRAAAEVATTGEVRPLALDVTNDASVTAAVDTIAAAAHSLDVLLNNAGIAGRSVSPAETTPADFLPVYGVNVLGPVRTTHALLPLLQRAESPRVVMVSSGLGSFGVTSDPARFESTLQSLVYPSSKTALNMITSQYAKAYPEIFFASVDPGYTATDLNGHSGPQPVEVGAEVLVQAVTGMPERPSGSFFDAAGPLPW